MVKIKDFCVGCTSVGLPCRGRGCSNRNVEVTYCDHCGREIAEGDYNECDGEDLCGDCFEELYGEEDEADELYG